MFFFSVRKSASRCIDDEDDLLLTIFFLQTKDTAAAAPKMGGPNSLFAGLGTPPGFPRISPLGGTPPAAADPLRKSSSSSTSLSSPLLVPPSASSSSSSSQGPKVSDENVNCQSVSKSLAFKNKK